MELVILHDKRIIFNYLIKNPELQVYCIGDLDDFFWPKTTWFALQEKDEIRAIALMYLGQEIPTLLSFYKENAEVHLNLIKQLKSFLPQKFYVHLSPLLIDVFGIENIIENYGHNYKMALMKKPEDINDRNIKNLLSKDLPAIIDLYNISYPNNWFDRKMLETGKYFGYFNGNNLVGISGIHVYSAKYKVAALGNITVHPDFRGKQIAYKLTSKLCYDLQKSVDFIGLNVKSDNDFAIRCYIKTGFEIVGQYDECLVHNC
jgi:ribosomal protein S18 acetylase RimI-like enzyme